MLNTSTRLEDFEPLMQLDMDVGLFASNWAYCDRVSSYVARMVSHNRADSLRYGNLFSSALNELLETVFRVHGPSGQFSCAVYRMGGCDRIELTLPADGKVRSFYRDTAGRLHVAEAPEHYRAALFAPGAVEPSIGLYELAVDYQARIRIEEPADGSLRLIAELVLEGEQD